MACIDALACDLARQARTADDVDLALLAAQLPVRAAAAPNAAPGGPGYPWTAAAAVDCMTVALKDPDDPARTMLADPAARLLALAAAADPAAVAPVVATVIAPDALHAWGMKAIRHLTRILPAIASKAPDLAIADRRWRPGNTRRRAARPRRCSAAPSWSCPATFSRTSKASGTWSEPASRN